MKLTYKEKEDLHFWLDRSIDRADKEGQSHLFEMVYFLHSVLSQKAIHRAMEDFGYLPKEKQ